MPRIRPITMDNLTVNIAPLSYDETENYVNEGRAMLQKKDPETTPEEWAQRTLKTVCFTLNKAAGVLGDKEKELTPTKLTQEYDMVFINFIYEEFLKMSGLQVAAAPKEEAPAKQEAPAKTATPITSTLH